MNGVIAKIRLLLPIGQKRALATLAGFLVVGIFLVEVIRPIRRRHSFLAENDKINH